MMSLLSMMIVFLILSDSSPRYLYIMFVLQVMTNTMNSYFDFSTLPMSICFFILWGGGITIILSYLMTLFPPGESEDLSPFFKLLPATLIISSYQSTKNTHSSSMSFLMLNLSPLECTGMMMFMILIITSVLYLSMKLMKMLMAPLRS